MKDLVEQPGKNAAGLQATLALLKRFTRHRLSYELSDLFDHYLAFMFVPTLALMALVLLGEVGLFNGVIPAAPIEAFFILAVLTLLLWLSWNGMLLVGINGHVYLLDGRQNLKPYSFNNTDLRRNYVEIMEGSKLMVTSVCPTCEIERPNRCKHCIKCDACVYRMDHHCRCGGEMGRRSLD